MKKKEGTDYENKLSFDRLRTFCRAAAVPVDPEGAQADSRLIALPAFPLLHGNFEVYRLFLRGAMNQLKLSARAYHRILKIARTIADLAGSEEIQSRYLVEALQYLLKADNGAI